MSTVAKNEAKSNKQAGNGRKVPPAQAGQAAAYEAALHLATERGWRVFPVHSIIDGRCTCGRDNCEHPGKHPRTPQGLNNATTSPNQIRAWGALWKGANLAIAPDVFFVLDSDPRHGGDASLAELEAEHGRLPVTLRTKTGGNGAHIYFNMPPGVEIRNKVGLLPGLDIRGMGGYVLVPPSNHISGGTYEWESENAPIADAPDWLVELCRKDQSKQQAETLPEESPRNVPGDAGTFWLEKALEGAATGSRNGQGFWLACQLRDAGLSQDDAAGVMQTYAQRAPAGGHPYTEREALASLKSAYKKAARSTARAQTPKSRQKPAGAAGAAPAAAPAPAQQPTGGKTAQQKEEARIRGLIQARKTPFQKSEMGNAERLIQLYGHKLAWAKPWNCWMVYDGTRWVRNQLGEVGQLAHKTIRSILLEAYGQPDDEDGDKERRKLIAWELHSESHASMKGMLGHAQDELPFDPTKADTAACIINCLNGTLDMRTGTLRPHDPADCLMKLAPAEWRGLNFHTLEVDRFLGQITCGEMDLLGVLRRSAGYSVSGTNKEKYIFLAHGGKDSGKTTFVEAISGVMGDYATAIDFRAFLKKKWDEGETPMPSIADLQGKRFAFASEVSKEATFDANTVKRVSGGDTIKARRLHENLIQFRATHTIWLVCNDPPKIDTSDEAAVDRLVILPFNMNMERDGIQLDKDLRDRLRDTPENRSAWLAWLVRGFMEWNQQKSIGHSTTVEVAKEDYRKNASPLADWLAERCDDAPDAVTASLRLYTDYREWCKAFNEEAVTGKMFGRLLGSAGKYQPEKIGGHVKSRAWRGIQLRSWSDPNPSPDHDQQGAGEDDQPAPTGDAPAETAAPAPEQQTDKAEARAFILQWAEAHGWDAYDGHEMNVKIKKGKRNWEIDISMLSLAALLRLAGELR